MKRLWLLLTVAGAALAVLVAMAASGTAQNTGFQELRFVEGEGEFRFVDNPPRSRARSRRADPRLSAGDAFAVTFPVSTPENRRIGTFHAQCVVTRGGRNFGRSVSQCSGTYDLPDGTLAITALLKGEQDPVTFAVVGGTSAYEGRRGSGSSKSRGRDSEISDATIRLLP